MTSNLKISKYLLFVTLCMIIYSSGAQAILPPVIEWKGKSEQLIASPDNPWLTPCEKSRFKSTPAYEETMLWLTKLAEASDLFSMESIGKSAEGRDIMMIVATSEKIRSAKALKASNKPTLLVQAGIHSGEIDGKDAGMMLLRDMAFGSKSNLLDQVNFLFIPILNVDGHENSSPFNRPNQRGPENMGWRTNSQNLNLNRDYAKLDTQGVRSVVKVINEYEPSLYMDIHVTDGADYQYDITYSGSGVQGNSPNIAKWLENRFVKHSERELKKYGHIPGPLIFTMNNRDFSGGRFSFVGGPRFSHSYGILRHLATVLVENHSLKPYRQRVLGTYVLLESTLNLLATEGATLKSATDSDRALRPGKIPSSYKVPQMANQAGFESLSAHKPAKEKSQAVDSTLFLGVESRIKKSRVTNREYVEWMGIAKTLTVAHYQETEPIDWINRPKGYWIPAAYEDVIQRLKIHGIRMETINEPREVSVEMYRIENAKFGNQNNQVLPYEGRIRVRGTLKPENRKQTFAAGSVFVSTDQPLGDLVMMLLEPISKDSFFSWGFFLNIFQRTEYMESYLIEPLAQKMLDNSPELRHEFEQKLKEDQDFAKKPYAILSWFYSKTPYYDSRYLLYPIGKEI